MRLTDRLAAVCTCHQRATGTSGDTGLLLRRWGDRALLATLFVGPLALYLRTLTPGLGTKDGFELQVVAATLGIAHPTGYPLISLLGRLFIALIPWGSQAYRVNLMCAVFAAAAIPLIYAISHRLLKQRIPALLGALCFAFAPTFWSQASIPEKYTLNVFFVALVLYVAIRFAQGTGEQRPRQLQRLAFVYGLSLTHHRTMLLLGPALALCVLLNDPELLRQPKRLLNAALLFGVPLLLYLYIPWRAYAQGWHMTWHEFWVQVSGSDYAGVLRPREILTSSGRWLTYLRFLRNEFGLWGIGVSLVGSIAVWLKDKRQAAVLLIAWLTYVVFSICHHAYYNDVNYFLPSHLVVALWLSIGLSTIAHTLIATTAHLHINWPQAARAGYWLVAVLLPLRLILTRLPLVDMSGATNLIAWGQYVLGLNLASGATILADSTKVAPLYYLTTVEETRQDVDIEVLVDEAAYVNELQTCLGEGKTVYLARYLPNLATYHLRSMGPLVEVSLSPLTEPSPTGVNLNCFFGKSIELLGYEAPTLTGQRQDSLHVTLYWRAQAAVEASYHVRLSLVDAEGRVCWQETGVRPVNDLYPTNAWRLGEIVPDYHEVPLSPELPPGDYSLQMGLFLPYAQEGLPVNGGPNERITLGTVVVESGWHGSAPTPTVMRHKELAHALTLVGVDMPERVTPGEKADVRLYWKATAKLAECSLALSMQAGSKSEISTSTLYPVSQWPTEELIVTQHQVQVPEDFDGQVGEITVQLMEHGKMVDEAQVGSVQIADDEVPESAVNLGKLLLTDYQVATTEIAPGGTLTMQATWQGLVDMDEDYTFFVHLLGPDGLLYGQVDVWPHEGTYPTSTWPVGEPIVDTYQVPLAADAPIGPYQIEVGVYLLRTMARLPVLDSAGVVLDDKVLISGLACK